MFVPAQQDAISSAPHRNLFTPEPIGLLHPSPAPVFTTKPSLLIPMVSEPRMRPTRFDYTPSFTEALTHAASQAQTEQKQGALMIVSLSNLAMVVDAVGREMAENAVLKLIEQINATLAADDCIERLHRDQLGIILSTSSLPDTHSTAMAIHRIVQNFGLDKEAGDGPGDSLHLTCSIGSVDFPTSAEAALDIIDKAYIALHSNQTGVGHRSYQDSKESAALSRQNLGLANYLRRAIRDNKLRLAFQPIIEAKTGRVDHYEALLRVISEDGKISSAGPLIPVAEQMGLIDLIDHLVLDMVVQELEESRQVEIAFNVSNLTTENHLWLEQCRHMLRGRPEIASRITVEITETAAHRDLRNAAYFVASLQELGCKVALDDFGSGYTSFRQLKTLSVDIVKIDGAFIKDIVENPDSRLFVKTLLEFTQAYGLESVAEFVETGEIAKILMDLGVDMLQGYYFGKPQNFRSWLNPVQG